MSVLGPLDWLRDFADVADEGDVHLLTGAARQLLAGVVHGMHPSATVESLALLRAMTDRLDALLVHRGLTDAEFDALIAEGRLIELRRRVWADVNALSREYEELRREVEMRRQARALGLAS